MADAQENQRKPLVSVTTSHACNVSNCADDPMLPTDDHNNGANTSNMIISSSSSSSSTDEQVRIDEDTEEYFKSFPPGYRFCPTDAELIVHYLNKKIKNEKLPRHKIHEVNLYKYSPEKISEIYQVLGEKEWYFFTPRDRKYSNGTRPNRAAGTGYWKATGADKAIRSNGSTIGFRKALVFYEGKPPKGEKTSWIMHEYRVNAQPRKKSCATDMRLDDYVLCRIYKKTDKSFKGRQKSEDEQNDNLYLNSIEQNVQLQQGDMQIIQSKSDSYSQYEKMDDHMEEDYRDYSEAISPNEVLEIPHLSAVPDISSGDMTKYNGNFLSSFDYQLRQTPSPVCFLPAPSVTPAVNKWDSKSKVIPMAPIYSTTSNVFGSDYLKEAVWDFKPQGLQEQMWDKTHKDFLPLDYDIQNISFVDPEVNLDNILNNNPPSNSFEGPSMPKREGD